jgi:monoamine oxidase
MSRKTNRRDFLKISSLTSLYALLWNRSSTIGAGHASVNRDTSAKTKSGNAAAEAEIIVVGAGAAGLGAARLLQEEGYDVIILEGRKRSGGRVWTDYSWPGSPLDLGASWIHGSKGNPLTELAKEFKVKTLPTDYDALLIYTPQGKPLTDDEQDKLTTRFEALLEAVDEAREEAEEDMSLQAAFDHALTGQNLSLRQKLELNYAINTLIEHEYAADVADLSLFYWDEGDDFAGGDVLFPGGYDQIIKGLAKGLEIKLEHVVQKVEYDQTGVTLTTNRGVFEAKRAVITLPLGVLKQGSVEFSPPLPAAKRAAIQRLGMGLLNKLYLRFPKAFWAEEPEFLDYIPNRKGEWAEWLNIYHYTGQPILVGFNAGRYGRQIEKLTNQEIIKAALGTLRTIYGASIPDPEAWLITRWVADPFAGGSYSYLPPNASSEDRDALAEPVADRLFFAGEATSRQYPATVHGALLSGRRAAKQITEL